VGELHHAGVFLAFTARRAPAFGVEAYSFFLIYGRKMRNSLRNYGQETQINGYVSEFIG
jgi:hypothetical protein